MMVTGDTGWMPGIERVETAALGGYGVPAGKMRATAVVAHVLEGWLATMVRWAQERPLHHQRSYHFVLGLDGRIVQFVPAFTPAWHAGRRDYVDGDGRSVDKDDPGARLVPPPWPLWEPERNPGGHTVAVAREGFSKDPWTPEQLEAVVRVIAWAMEQHEITPSVETLIGHYELNPATRAHDPGGDWDKESMLASIAPAPAPAPGAVEALTALSVAAARAATALERREP